MATPLVEGEDYYINEDGFYVFTEKYHLERGYCCQNSCLHCPYGFKKQPEEQKTSETPPGTNKI